LLENQQQQQHQQKDFTTYLIVGKGYIAGAIFHAGKMYCHTTDTDTGALHSFISPRNVIAKNRIETVLN